MSRFFEFPQNNSGGSFAIDDEAGIGPRVWIEAETKGLALSRALSIGIYFDGCDSGIDCSCCGDRWSEPWDDGQDAPEINNEYDFNWHDAVYVHRIDGTIERITKSDDAKGDAP
jgi:hypothetical protein